MNSPDRYAVIGHPVSHSRSPFIHQQFAAQSGQSLEYTTIDAKPEQFADTGREFIHQLQRRFLVRHGDVETLAAAGG